jgi:putative SOS response-associated peptidase YedK
MMDDGIFAFAGLWERWRDESAGQMLETCTILTTSPNSLIADVHNRMPVILSPGDYDQWLDPGVNNPSRVIDLLKPLDARLMRYYPVGDRVNHVDNDDEDCAREVPPKIPVVQTLF